MRIVSLGGVVIAAAIVGISASCDNPFSSPDQSVILGVTKFEAPTTVAPGTAITVVLTVTTGGCLSFDHIEVNRDASGANLTVWGRDATIGRKGIVCTQEAVSAAHSYRFDPPFTNSFTIEVNQGRLAPLQATVQVQ
jgi:hypothetical protein